MLKYWKKAHDKLTYNPFKSFFKLKLSNSKYSVKQLIFETYKLNFLILKNFF